MPQEGLVEVENPSMTLFDGRAKPVGTVVVASMEGTRPMLLEYSLSRRPFRNAAQNDGN